ncbi:MAG TPA: hypothetical protein VGQ83_13535, partial [Polyangia bacterium]
ASNGVQARQIVELGGRLETLEDDLRAEVERLADFEEVLSQAARAAGAGGEGADARLTELQAELDRKNEELQLSLLEVDRLKGDSPATGRGGLEARVQDLNMQLGDRDAEIILLHSRIRAQRQWAEKVRQEIEAYRQRSELGAGEIRGLLDELAGDLGELQK